MNQIPNRMLTAGESRKRKDRDTIYKPKAGPGIGMKPGGEPVCSNRVLAGYLAHEYLTKGTLLGEKFDPARAGAVPVRGTISETRKLKMGAESESTATGTKMGEQESYGEVASILKTEGAHIPGIVNPTQLARWLKM